MTVFVWPALFGVALVAGMWITERRSEDSSFARKTYLLGIWGGIIGARAWFSAQYGLGSAGMSFWGFVFGAALAVSLYRRVGRGHWHLTDFPDAVVPAILLGGALVRVACFLQGCCFGSVSGLPWAVSYGPFTPAYESQLRQGFIDGSASSSLPVHPTQLYEALLGAGLFLTFLLTRRTLRLPRHFVFLLTVALYAVFRFFLEFVRGDSGGRHFGPLTFAQVTSMAMLLVALALICRRIPMPQQPTPGTESQSG